MPTNTPQRGLPHITFVMEQHLGHRTYAENIRTALQHRTDLTTTWIPITYEVSGAWWERIPIEGLRAAMRGRRQVRQAGPALDADVVVFNSQVPAVLGGQRARRRPFVVCMDDTPRLKDAMAAGYGHKVDRFGLIRSAKDRWNTHVLRDACAIAPWSNWVRDSLVRDYGVDPSVIEVIPPGINIEGWAPASHAGDGPMRILFVGGEFERKGGPLLLEAFEGLPPGRAELHVVTRSDVPARSGVHVYNNLSQNDPTLKGLFREADVFVMPSQWEMFGIAAIEAAAAALPIIVTKVGGLGDLVIDGSTGFAIEPSDGPALLHRLETLMEDPERRRRMGHAARQRATIEFDAGTNAGRLVRLALDSARRAA